jgi:hypothetical protein
MLSIPQVYADKASRALVQVKLLVNDNILGFCLVDKRQFSTTKYSLINT